jgi:hypothetical protein
MIELETLKAEYGSTGIRLNRRLVIQKNLSDEQIVYILHLHEMKLMIMDNMSKTDVSDRDALVKMAENITSLEYQLQDAWDFPRNEDYHCFWYLPHCSCPKLDNDDAYPSGWYVRSSDCPIHGEQE